MEVARAEDQCHYEEEADTRIQRQTDGPPHQGLAEGAYSGEEVAEKVELGDLGRVRQQAADVGAEGVDGNVQPAADGVVGRVLPRLQAVAMAEVVCGLPVVEGLVAVLNRGEEGGDDVGGEEDVEGRDGLDGEGILDCPGGVALSVVVPKEEGLQLQLQVCNCRCHAQLQRKSPLTVSWRAWLMDAQTLFSLCLVQLWKPLWGRLWAPLLCW